MEIKDIRRARVRQIIDRDFGGKDADFAARVDKQPSYISRLFTDKAEHLRNIGEKMARDFEKRCGLEPGSLDRPLSEGDLKSAAISGAATPRIQPSVAMSDIQPWDEDTPLDDDEVYVPFLREVELAAGSGRFAIEENEGAKLRFFKTDLRRNNVQFVNAKCVLVSGNSMLPVLRDGATVGINVGKNSLSDIVDGDMYAIAHHGQLRVKQLYRLPSGIRLRSFNRDEHPDEDYTFADIQDQQISILGHVFWWGMFAR
ncbi:XRE family transcriptional regulator [Pseudomonas sp. N3-W]|uniref:S24 family peptidase n=1 Tax=Pseudomonas fungipugnans TaxID=3024217 RepID=A0ABT6QX20_9PSED|nr:MULTISPECIES: S24 family peptidase [unclassified Pseudomonas]MDI2595366.1 S24 family peptidase [Pseudomonas sp. 681]UWF51648.1 XRE family transcriptional regulator [Pseudomonas sp. N3-W]